MSLEKVLRIIEIEDTIKILRGQNAQLRNHLQALLIMLNDGEVDEAIELLQELMEE
jgi:hypothetical protein